MTIIIKISDPFGSNLIILITFFLYLYSFQVLQYFITIISSFR